MMIMLMIVATIVQAGRTVVQIPVSVRFFTFPKRPHQQWGKLRFVFRGTAVLLREVGTLIP